MKLEKGLELSHELLDMDKGLLDKHFKKFKVCGSIRRKKPEVHDIDIVGILKPESSYQFGDETIDATIERIHDKSKEKPVLGSKVKRFYYKGEKIDIYVADEKTFECLVLIRTGSAEHNIRLTTIAKQRGQKLYANGNGLCKIKGGLYNNEPEEIIEVVESTEDGILQNLLGRVPTPEKRD